MSQVPSHAAPRHASLCCYKKGAGNSKEATEISPPPPGPPPRAPAAAADTVVVAGRTGPRPLYRIGLSCSATGSSLTFSSARVSQVPSHATPRLPLLLLTHVHRYHEQRSLWTAFRLTTAKAATVVIRQPRTLTSLSMASQTTAAQTVSDESSELTAAAAAAALLPAASSDASSPSRSHAASRHRVAPTVLTTHTTYGGSNATCDLLIDYDNRPSEERAVHAHGYLQELRPQEGLQRGGQPPDREHQRARPGRRRGEHAG